MALRLGMKVIGFAEHVNAASTYWNLFIEDVDALQSRLSGRIEILRGIEVRVTDFRGHLDLPASVFPEADYVVGVVHSYPSGAERLDDEPLVPREAAQIEFEALKGLILHGCSSIIGHIGGTFEVLYQGYKFPRVLRRELLRLARNNDKVVEFNSRYHYPVLEWMDDLIEAGVRVSLGSDAHACDQVGHAYQSMIKALTR